MSEAGHPAATLGWEAWRQRSRQWRRYWIRDPLQGALYYGIHHASRPLPPDFCSAIGARLGRFNAAYFYDGLRVRAERMYGQLKGEPVGEDEARRAVLGLFENVGRVALEYALLDRLWRERRIEVAGQEHLLGPRALGRPVIVMGLHLSNWETLGPTIIGLGEDGIVGPYQPLPSRFETRIIVNARRRYGATPLRPGVAAARAAHRRLFDERGVLLVYADEERRGYVSAPLFGRPMPPRANILDIARLAVASGAPVIPAYAERLGGARFRVTFLPEAELDRNAGGGRAALLENVHRLDDIITPVIRTHLDQWYMLFEYRNRPYPNYKPAHG